MNNEKIQLDPKVLNITGQLIGGLLLLIALGLTALSAWMIERRLNLAGTIELDVLIAAVAIAFIALFFWAVGLRLALNRPNRYGSILPPVGWYVLAAFFVVLAVIIGIAAIQQKTYDTLLASLLPALPAVLCWRQGKAAAARVRATSK